MKKALILLCALLAFASLSSCAAEDNTNPNGPQIPLEDGGDDWDDDDFDFDDFDFDAI